MVKKIDGFTLKAIHLREKLSVIMMIKLAIVFVLSLILSYATGNEVLNAFFGFIMIIAGTLILLFILVYLIFFFVERIDSGKNIQHESKKIAPKRKVVAKKKVVKKTVKKKVIKKKAAKKAIKKAVKKKATKKKAKK